MPILHFLLAVASAAAIALSLSGCAAMTQSCLVYGICPELQFGITVPLIPGQLPQPSDEEYEEPTPVYEEPESWEL